jgi:hypothetical protein
MKVAVRPDGFVRAAALVSAIGLCILLVSGCPEVCPLCGIPGSGVGNAPGSPPDTTGAVSYGLDIQAIWDKNCVMCHRTGGVAQTFFGIPLELTSGQALDGLINVRSVQNSNWTLVVPGDPEASLLFLKISESQPPVGETMPLFQPPLLNDEVELVRRWIEDGAQAN